MPGDKQAWYWSYRELIKNIISKYCRAEGPPREGSSTRCVSSPLHCFRLWSHSGFLGAIVTSDDVVTAVMTPPVSMDLMKAKIMFRLFCNNQIYVTHLLVRFVQVRRSPSWNKTQGDSVWYCLFISQTMHFIWFE